MSIFVTGCANEPIIYDSVTLWKSVNTEREFLNLPLVHVGPSLNLYTQEALVDFTGCYIQQQKAVHLSSKSCFPLLGAAAFWLQSLEDF